MRTIDADDAIKRIRKLWNKGEPLEEAWEHDDYAFGLSDAIDAVDDSPTIEPSDDIGKLCYKIYVIAERRRFPGTYYDYFCDTIGCLNYWKRHILYGGEATLYAKGRPFTKSDKLKLGKTVFWTKEEAEEAIGIVYGERKESE